MGPDGRATFGQAAGGIWFGSGSGNGFGGSSPLPFSEDSPADSPKEIAVESSAEMTSPARLTRIPLRRRASALWFLRGRNVRFAFLPVSKDVGLFMAGLEEV